jgi:hypothetical protein
VHIDRERIEPDGEPGRLLARVLRRLLDLGGLDVAAGVRDVDGALDERRQADAGAAARDLDLDVGQRPSGTPRPRPARR